MPPFTLGNDRCEFEESRSVDFGRLDANNSAEQQRRRNSSIAKLLGGQPLNNHQYEGREISRSRTVRKEISL